MSSAHVARPRARVPSTAIALWILLSAFVLRVVGQLLVVLGWAPFLPPMEQWYSGLLPYGPLLASQIVIIALYARASLDITRGSGFWARPRAALGRGLLIFGGIYLGAMVVRYALGIGPVIPILFHWVLATFLLVLGSHHRRGATRS